MSTIVDDITTPATPSSPAAVDNGKWVHDQHASMLAQLGGILATQKASEALLLRALESKKAKKEEATLREQRRAEEEEDGDDVDASGDAVGVFFDVPVGTHVEDVVDPQTYVRQSVPNRAVADGLDDIEADVKRAVAQVRDWGVRDEGELSQENVWHIPKQVFDDEDEDNSNPATKPWQASIVPPSTSPDASDAAPEVDLELDHIFGLKTRSSCNNIAALDANTIIFPVGCVGVVMDTTTKNQKFFRAHSNDITCLAYSYRMGVVATGQIGRLGTICLWHANTRRLLAELPCHLRGVAAVAMSEDGRRLASVGLDGDHTLVIHDISQVLDMATTVNTTTATNDEEVSSPNPETQTDTDAPLAICPELLRQGSGPVPGVSLCWQPTDPLSEGQYRLVLTGCDGVSFWANTTPHGPFTHRSPKYGSFSGHSAHTLLCCAAIHPSITLVGSSTGALLVFCGSTLMEVVDAHKRAVYCIQLVSATSSSSDDGELLTHKVLTSGQDGFVHTWTITHPSHIRSGSQAVLSIMTPVVARLPTSTNSYSVTQDGECVGEDPVRAIALIPAEEEGAPAVKCYFGSASGTLWNASLTRNVAKKICTSHHGDLRNVAGYGELWAGAAHPGGEPLVVTAGEDCVMYLWNVEKKTCVRSTEMADKAVCLAWSPANGHKYIALGTVQGSIVLCNSKNLFHISSQHPSLKRVQSLSFSPDGSLLAAGGADNTIRIYKVDAKRDELELQSTIQSHSSTVTHVDFSADGVYLQSCSQAYELLFHRIEGGCQIEDPAEMKDTQWATQNCILGWSVQGIWPRNLDGSEINSVCASANGALLASAEVSGLVKVYRYPCIGSGLHPVTGTLPRRPACVAALGHSFNVTTVLFVADGKYLVSLGGSDNAVFVWKIRPRVV